METFKNEFQMRKTNQLEELASVVHGALSALHLLGIIYNLRRKRWPDLILHSIAFGYDIHSMNKHLKDININE